MIGKLLNGFVIFALLLDVLVRNYSFQFPEHFYYKAEAFLILSIASNLFYYKTNIITFIVLSLSINNLLDELFFNPLELELNEILTAIAILIFAIYKYYNDRKRAKLI